MRITSRLAFLLVLLSRMNAFSVQLDDRLEPISVDSLLGMRFIKESVPLAITADGRWVAFTTEDRRLKRAVQSNIAQFAGCRIVMADTSSGRLTEITPSGWSAWMPSWSPDGSRLAFFADDGGGTHVWIWSPNGGASRVTRSPFAVSPWAEIRWIMHGSAVIVPISGVRIADSRQTSLDQEADPDRPTVEVRISPRRPFDALSAVPGGQNQMDQRLIEIDIQTGNMTELFSASSGVAAVAPDGSRLVYARYRSDIKRREGAQYQRYSDLWLSSVSRDPPVRLAEAVPLAFPLSARVSWSPDGRYIAYRTLGLAEERKVVMVRVGLPSSVDSVDTGECAVGNIANEAPLWNDDSSAAIFTDGDSIRECSAADGRKRTLATIKGVRLDYIVSRTYGRLWSPSHKAAIWVIGRSIVGGCDGVYEIDVLTGKARTILEEQRAIGGNARIAPQVSAADNGELVVFTSESATEPADLWSIRNCQAPKRLTTLNPVFSGLEMGKRELLEWTNSAGERARALVLLPAAYTPSRKYPTIVWVYAEATSNFANSFGLSGSQFYNLQMFATRGYVVLYPDLTWKPGTVMRSIADQVLPAVDQLIKTGMSDPERIGVIGHSSGGYDVLALLVQTDRFRAAMESNGSGIYDLASTFAGDMDSAGPADWVMKQMRIGVPPWNKPQAYIDNSPGYHLDHVTTPLLMLEGLSDTGWNNVAQSEHLFSALNWLGKSVEYRRYPGEEHAPDWWSPVNKRDAEVRMLNWFSEYLGGLGADN